MFKYFLYKIGQFFVNFLPQAVAYRIAIFISDMQYYFSPRDKEAVTENLKIICQSQDKKKLPVRNVFRNFGRYLVEFFQMGCVITQEYVDEKVKISNLQNIEDVLSRGKGGIVLTAHLGNWELGSAVLNKLGYSLTAVALPHKERPVNDLFNFQREKQGIKVLPMHDSVKGCMQALKANKLIALVGDRDFGDNGVLVDFFHKKTSFPKGAAVFAIRTGCGIIPTFLVRDDKNNFILSSQKPIYAEDFLDEDNHDKLIEKIIKKYVSIIEREIKKYPDQWLMFRRFWRD